MPFGIRRHNGSSAAKTFHIQIPSPVLVPFNKSKRVDREHQPNQPQASCVDRKQWCIAMWTKTLAYSRLVTNLLLTADTRLVIAASDTACFACAATTAVHPSLLQRTHRGHLMTLTAGVPHVLVIAIHIHVSEAHRIDVRVVVADVRANKEWSIGSGRLAATGSPSQRG